MKYSRTLDHHHLQFLLCAVEGHVLEGPVPVVVIILTEVVTTLSNLVPLSSGKTDPHVVLPTQPAHHLSLEYMYKKYKKGDRQDAWMKVFILTKGWGKGSNPKSKYLT